MTSVSLSEDTPLPAASQVPLRAVLEGHPLLASLPPVSAARLVAVLEPVRVAVGQVLVEAGEPVAFVYLPHSCSVSLLTVLADGRDVEVATIGTEGLVGALAGLDTGPEPLLSPHRAVCQVAGAAWQVPASVFQALVAEDAALRGLVGRTVGILLNQISQTAACNARHPLAARAVRWLLRTGERMGADTFPLTQQLIAQMLNVRRPAVSEALAPFQQAGLLTFRHGMLTLHDRATLTAAACACYHPPAAA